MTNAEFLSSFSKILDAQPELTEESVLADLPGWDSMANISFIAMADEDLGIAVSAEDVASAQTVGDLKKLIKAALAD